MSSVGRQFAWVALGRVLAAAAQAVLMVLLIRTTAVADFAVVAAVYGLLIFAQTVAGLGLQTLVIRERSHGVEAPLVGAALRLADRVAALLALAVLAVGVAAGVAWDPRYLLMLPLAVWSAGEQNADTWMGVSLADGRGQLVTANLVGRRLLNLGGFVALHAAGVPAVLAFGTSSATAAVASVIFAHLVVRRVVGPRDRLPLRVVLRASSSYWITSVAAMARNVDAALVHTVTGPVQAGFYAAAARLSGPMRLLPQSLASVLLPTATRRGEAGLGRSLHLVRWAVLVLAVGYVAGVALLPWLTGLLLREAYAGAVLALQITAVNLIFAASATLLSAVLQGVGRTAYVARVAVLTTVVFLVGAVVGGHLGGAAGAAVGVGVSYLVQSVLLAVRAVRLARASRTAGGSDPGSDGDPERPSAVVGAEAGAEHRGLG